MKCPRCWAEKAYARKVKGWKGILLALLFLQPMKCHHCYLKFVVLSFSTIGKQIAPPPSRRGDASQSNRPTPAAEHPVAARVTRRRANRRKDRDHRTRAKAA